ncbi:MAG: hypothetical protein IT427_12490 [Pirellulales bacterium]|nr:hypothetical protein [Pirellulales bacterium]
MNPRQHRLEANNLTRGKRERFAGRARKWYEWIDTLAIVVYISKPPSGTARCTA